MLARIIKHNDALKNAYHIRSHSHACIFMKHKCIEQVVTNSAICDCGEIGRLGKKKLVCHYRSYHVANLTSNLVLQST